MSSHNDKELSQASGGLPEPPVIGKPRGPIRPPLPAPGDAPVPAKKHARPASRKSKLEISAEGKPRFDELDALIAQGEEAAEKRRKAKRRKSLRKLRRKPRRRYLPPEVYTRLAGYTTSFAGTLRNDPELAPFMGTRHELAGFRHDLQGLIRDQLPLRRGRPPDPRFDDALRMIAEGMTEDEVLRSQNPGWDTLDPYFQGFARKHLRQAMARAEKQDSKLQPQNPPENSA